MRFSFSHLLILLAVSILAAQGRSYSQVCQVDSQYTSPGVYPSDTLPDMTVGVAYNEVVQFVFPSDTTVSGYTVNFDSFVVLNVTGIPNGIDWECNANHPQCHYICNPPALTRGCVTIFGTPTAQSPAYPSHDSIMVTGQAWVTIPFIGAQSFNQDFPVYYRVEDTTLSAIGDEVYGSFSLEIAPNPATHHARVTFDLSAAAEVTLTVVDVYGREVLTLGQGLLPSGAHETALKLTEMEPGIYFLRATLNENAHVLTKRFLKLN